MNTLQYFTNYEKKLKIYQQSLEIVKKHKAEISTTKLLKFHDNL